VKRLMVMVMGMLRMRMRMRMRMKRRRRRRKKKKKRVRLKLKPVWSLLHCRNASANSRSVCVDVDKMHSRWRHQNSPR